MAQEGQDGAASFRQLIIERKGAYLRREGKIGEPPAKKKGIKEEGKGKMERKVAQTRFGEST